MAAREARKAAGAMWRRARRPKPICLISLHRLSLRNWATSAGLSLLQGMVPLLGAAVGLDTERRAQFATENSHSLSSSSPTLSSQRKSPFSSYALLPSHACSSSVAPSRLPSRSQPAPPSIRWFFALLAGSFALTSTPFLKRLSLNSACLEDGGFGLRSPHCSSCLSCFPCGHCSFYCLPSS